MKSSKLRSGVLYIRISTTKPGKSIPKPGNSLTIPRDSITIYYSLDPVGTLTD